MLYCELVSMSLSVGRNIFLSSFDDMNGICQEYYLHIGHNLC
jgi:hypothetical protein